VVITQGRLLGGRLTYSQPVVGFRSGIEPVLLAAAVPAKSGQHVLEAGTGAGAALLCLHARVHGLRSLGVEIDPAMVRLATTNAAANSFTSMEVLAGAIESVALQQDVDHAIANPPYHLAAGTASPLAARDTAKRGSIPQLLAWVGRLGAALRHGGTLTLIVRAGGVPACLLAMADAACSCTMIFPLWPAADRPAKLVLIRGVRDSRAPMRLSPGLVLHQADGSFTEAAQAVLRDALPLPLG